MFPILGTKLWFKHIITSPDSLFLVLLIYFKTRIHLRLDLLKKIAVFQRAVLEEALLCIEWHIATAALSMHVHGQIFWVSKPAGQVCQSLHEGLLLKLPFEIMCKKYTNMP